MVSSLNPFFCSRNMRKGRRAYVLLEVILATGIFAIAGVSLVTALNNMASVFLRVRTESAIRVQLEARLTQARIRPLAVMKEKDEPDSRGVVYGKEVELLQMSNDDKIVLGNLYRITITASWKEGKEEQNERAEIYVYQP